MKTGKNGREIKAMKKLILSAILVMALPVHSEVIRSKATPLMEEIIVEGERLKSEERAIIQTLDLDKPDSAALLKSLPGANVNSNGPLTGIAQYRGLFGDRVAVSMENEAVLSGGPNAMDAPLSYAPPLLLKSLELTTGIAPVSASQEAIGGHITATLDRGEFAATEDAKLSGAATSRYGSVDDGVNHALKAVAANNQHKLAALASYDDGNDAETGGGKTLTGTGYRRERYDLSYGWQNETNELLISAGKLETDNTGTPALPMDIKYIDTDMVNFNATNELDGFTLHTRAGYRHVLHLMDNFSQRTNSMPMRFRQNKASGQQVAWGASVDIPVGGDRVSIGIDGTQTLHNALITNPNMAMFAVNNFSDAERDIYGIFTEWQGSAGLWDLEAGMRYNYVDMNSDKVSANGMMPMMQGLADRLADDFNNSDRDQGFNNVDVVLKASRQLTDSAGFSIGAGRKTRAPSYQELYLWLPLEATGGLADGRTYIGNLDLDSEVNYEINMGLDWQDSNFYANGQVYFRKVDDFIQGTPSTNMAANMLANMMTGQAPLQFNNIDAELYGFDGRYGVALNDSWQLDGVLSYVRGEDKNNNDNLYRIAPLNHSLALSWQKAAFTARLESVLYASQSKVSSYNDEKKSAGYGLLNLRGKYQVTRHFDIRAGVENMLDKDYEDHLTGYNRNADSDIPVGDRLPGRGRNLFVAINMVW
ncbi:MAG: TonB-dependent receptor [Gammaproteobacteria bacterium]|nr:MAG: TonB-dependent receptor [Gammaproteobacteria bacterium]